MAPQMSKTAAAAAVAATGAAFVLPGSAPRAAPGSAGSVALRGRAAGNASASNMLSTVGEAATGGPPVGAKPIRL